MKSLRKYYWYISAFLSKHWKTLFFAVFAGVVIFQLLFNLLPSFVSTKKTLYIGRIGSVTLTSLPLDIQRKISDGLTAVGPQGQPLAALAERWSIEDDGKTFRFVLRKNIRWQDGKELTPDDVVYNFSDTELHRSEQEVVFKLKDVFVPFPIVVSQPIFREEDGKIIGTGKYWVKSMVKNGSIIKEFHIESPEEEIVYRFYPTEDSLVLAFKRGDVDVMEDLSSDHGLGQERNIFVYPQVRKDQYIALFFNLQDPLFDKNLRLALNYALAKSEDEERSMGPLNQTSWAYNKTVKNYEKDSEKAVEFILRAVPKQKLTLELTTAAQFLQQAEQIKKEWEEFGHVAQQACEKSKDIKEKQDCLNLSMEVQLRISNFPDLNNFQVLLVGQQIPPDPDQYALWHSTQNTNFMHYKSPKVDKLLEDGRKALSQDERKAIYADFQQYVVEDSPAVFLNYLTTYLITRGQL